MTNGTSELAQIFPQFCVDLHTLKKNDSKIVIIVEHNGKKAVYSYDFLTVTMVLLERE